MLEKLIKKYIGEYATFADILFATFLVIILFTIYTFVRIANSKINDTEYTYNKCIMQALEKLEKSADVFSVCKELK